VAVDHDDREAERGRMIPPHNGHLAKQGGSQEVVRLTKRIRNDRGLPEGREVNARKSPGGGQSRRVSPQRKGQRVQTRRQAVVVEEIEKGWIRQGRIEIATTVETTKKVGVRRKVVEKRVAVAKERTVGVMGIVVGLKEKVGEGRVVKRKPVEESVVTKERFVSGVKRKDVVTEEIGGKVEQTVKDEKQMIKKMNVENGRKREVEMRGIEWISTGEMRVIGWINTREMRVIGEEEKRRRAEETREGRREVKREKGMI